MQPVQAWSRRVPPPETARTRWIFGFQRRLVFRFEWLTELPKPGFLPQISQTAAIGALTGESGNTGSEQVTSGIEASQSWPTSVSGGSRPDRAPTPRLSARGAARALASQPMSDVAVLDAAVLR